MELAGLKPWSLSGTPTNGFTNNSSTSNNTVSNALGGQTDTSKGGWFGNATDKVQNWLSALNGISHPSASATVTTENAIDKKSIMMLVGGAIVVILVFFMIKKRSK